MDRSSNSLSNGQSVNTTCHSIGNETLRVEELIVVFEQVHSGEPTPTITDWRILPWNFESLREIGGGRDENGRWVAIEKQEVTR